MSHKNGGKEHSQGFTFFLNENSKIKVKREKILIKFWQAMLFSALKWFEVFVLRDTIASGFVL